jgi:YcxB-like protein
VLTTTRYSLGAEELREVWRWYALNDQGLRRSRRLALVPVGLACVLALLALSGVASVTASRYAILILLIAFAVVSRLIWTSFPDRVARRLDAASRKGATPALYGENVLTLDDNGLRSESTHGSAQLKWSAFTGYTELERTIVLWQGRHMFVAIPKRAIPSESMSTLLKSLHTWLRAA